MSAIRSETIGTYSSGEGLTETLRCPRCHGGMHLEKTSTEAELSCSQCAERFPVTGGIPRMLLSPFREALLGNAATDKTKSVQIATALSFGFEWTRFPEMYDHWEQSFLDYMQPHTADFFKGRKVLDAGCGNGRFAHYAGKYGAEVWAIDIGPAVEVARRNCGSLPNVQVVQADLHNPPFELESFDFIYSLGVLHHLTDPEPSFQTLVKFLKPGGEIQIYLYWEPENQRVKAALLAGVTAARRVTARLPHRLQHALAFPAAFLAHVAFVWPHKVMRRIPGLQGIAERMPMKQYAQYPFRVCVNDQLDRFSAPIENRYTRQETRNWLERAGLENISIAANYGWTATGRKPA